MFVCICRELQILQWHICERVLPSFGYANQERYRGVIDGAYGNLHWLGECCLRSTFLCSVCFYHYSHYDVLFPLPCEVTLGARGDPRAMLSAGRRDIFVAPDSPS